MKKKEQKGEEKMEIRNIKGKIQTVLGVIDPNDLGVTICHDHIFWDGRGIFIEPTNASDRVRAYLPITADMPLEHWGWINYNYMNNRDNFLMVEEDVAVKEVELYKRSGGNSIVEVTPIGVGRDPNGLARVARATGVHIIMGTAYYVSALHPRDVEAMSEDEVCNIFVNEINVGVIGSLKGGGVIRTGQIPIRAGIIGEIGCSWPWQASEKKVLRAAAKAQRKTGAPISIHPGRSEQSIIETIEVLRDAGADLGRTIFGHIERTITSFEVRKTVADAGCYLEYDEFMMDSNYPLSDIDLPNDYGRINQILELIDHGYVNQVLLSQDICTKTRLVTYGGLGYGHILNNVIPKMRRKGISEDQIQSMLVDNPKRVLTFASPKS